MVAGIFSELGVEVRTNSLPWKRAVLLMKRGELDMILTIFYTKERAKFMKFTLPFVDVPTVVVVAKGKTFPFAKLSDFDSTPCQKSAHFRGQANFEPVSVPLQGSIRFL